jgi:hypothetical protein
MLSTEKLYYDCERGSLGPWEAVGRDHVKHGSIWSRCYATNARWADIAGQFLGNNSVNTFRLLVSRFLIKQRLDYNNKIAVFSTWSVPRHYKQGTRLERSQFCTGVCEERT